jgi:orotate phosphoribosyltransferase
LRLAFGYSLFIIRQGKELPFEKIKLPTRKGLPAAQKLAGQCVALITDHTTSGAEILQAVRAIEAVGGRVSDVIAYTIKPDLAYKAIVQLINKKVAIHSIYYMYDLADGTYRMAEGGSIEDAADIVKINPR